MGFFFFDSDDTQIDDDAVTLAMQALTEVIPVMAPFIGLYWRK